MCVYERRYALLWFSCILAILWSLLMHFTVHYMPGEKVPTPLIVAKYVHTIGVVGILILFIPFIRYESRAPFEYDSEESLRSVVADAVHGEFDAFSSDAVYVYLRCGICHPVTL